MADVRNPYAKSETKLDVLVASAEVRLPELVTIDESTVALLEAALVGYAMGEDVITPAVVDTPVVMLPETAVVRTSAFEVVLGPEISLLKVDTAVTGLPSLDVDTVDFGAPEAEMLGGPV